jgi:hypothetical protein
MEKALQEFVSTVAHLNVEAKKDHPAAYTVPSKNLLELVKLGCRKDFNIVVTSADDKHIGFTFVTRYASPDVKPAKDAAFQCCF